MSANMKLKSICPSYSALIAEWIKTNVGNAGLKGVVLGLSGGIDSAVVAGLCAMVLKEKTLGLIMPCGSESEDEKDALLLADKFGIKTELVRLDGVLDSFSALLPDASELAKANIKPRLRMATLYFWANKLSYMVVGTGNKSELMAGYFTKYGDGGVDLLPLGGLYKSEVKKLAIELEVPSGIINKPPSAGLWRGQTDEAEMGLSYDELESALRAIESGAREENSRSLMEKVEKMKAGSAHKRKLPSIYEVAE